MAASSTRPRAWTKWGMWPIADGRIIAVGTAPTDFTPTQTIDASGCSCCPAWSIWPCACASRGTSTPACWTAKWQAAVAGGVTSLVCPPDTDPVLDEQGLVEMLKFRAEKLHQARLFPLGALTRGLQGDTLTEMAELTEAGCVGFGQADVPMANTQALPAPAICHHVWLHRVAAPAGQRPGQRRGRQRPLATRMGLAGHSGGRRNHCPAHHFRAGARHANARPPVPPQQCGRGGLVRQAKAEGLPM
jgi:dihydroorotase